MKNSNIIFIFVIISMSLFAGCSLNETNSINYQNSSIDKDNEKINFSKENSYSQNNFENDEHYPSKNNKYLKSITFDKDSYSPGSKATATFKINNDFEPFRAIILYKMSREGFITENGNRYLYKKGFDFLVENKEIERPVAFSFSGDRSWSKPSASSSFTKEGIYNYEFMLYSCKSIKEEFGKECDCDFGDYECDEFEYGYDSFEDGEPTSEPLDKITISVEVK
jgi:hypothetical protein